MIVKVREESIGENSKFIIGDSENSYFVEDNKKAGLSNITTSTNHKQQMDNNVYHLKLQWRDLKIIHLNHQESD